MATYGGGTVQVATRYASGGSANNATLYTCPANRFADVYVRYSSSTLRVTGGTANGSARTVTLAAVASFSVSTTPFRLGPGDVLDTGGVAVHYELVIVESRATP